MQIYSSYCAYLCANYFSVNNLPLLPLTCGKDRPSVANSPMCLGEVQAAYSSASLHRGFPANVCILGCKRYTWRLQTLYLAVANVIPGGRMYLPCRTHVRAGAVTRTCRSGCKYLRLNLDQIGSADALHCRTGCSALRGKPLFFSQPHGLCHEQ